MKFRSRLKPQLTLEYERSLPIWNTDHSSTSERIKPMDLCIFGTMLLFFFFQRTYLKAMVPKNAISMNQRKAAPILDQPWSELVRANDMKPKDWFTQHLAIPMTHRHPWQQWMRMKLRVTRGMITSLEGRSIQSRGRTDRGRWQRRIIKERKCRGTEVGRWMREGQTLQVHLAWRKNTHWSSLSY